MAGFEPASEKFDLQTSTSIVGLFEVSRQLPRQTGSMLSLTDSPRKGFLASLIGVWEEHVDIYDALLMPDQRTVRRDEVPALGTNALHSIMQRVVERYMQLCGWHFCVCFQFIEL